jgi:hypothetical protein
LKSKLASLTLTQETQEELERGKKNLMAAAFAEALQQ